MDLAGRTTSATFGYWCLGGASILRIRMESRRRSDNHVYMRTYFCMKGVRRAAWAPPNFLHARRGPRRLPWQVGSVYATPCVRVLSKYLNLTKEVVLKNNSMRTFFHPEGMCRRRGVSR